ncbi:MAG: penicillin-binding protein 1C [Sphingobacteriales bacterium]|nr:penicillin-binding protein 1C [Sphingobacteriales bacterium]
MGIAAVFFLLLHILFPLRPHISHSVSVAAADGVPLYAFLSDDDKWRLKTELSEISTTLRKALIHKEDKYFYYHFGINPVAILRAAFNNMLLGKRSSGASTITMQVARLLEPKQRTYTNKLREVFRALQLEILYSKDEILQFYINLVPYGSNIEGIKSAAALYFGKSPALLSIAEITTLAIIPNRPSSLRLGDNNAYIVQERNRWLRRFAAEGVFTAAAIETALAEPLNARRQSMPRQAPHYSRRMKEAFPQMVNIHGSLRAEQQRKAEQIVQNFVRRTKRMHINNAAAIVINNRNKAVEVYVGSGDFFDTIDGGQVDGVKAVRSPGSTLKPFLYGLAFDKGIITPKTIISDVPVNYSGYMPANFDKQYNGYVSVEKALALSLNIPAVKVLNEVQLNDFIDLLVNGQCRQIERDRKKMGLSLALGGCGVRLEELSNLYAALARGGQFSRLKWLQGDSISREVPLLSASATYMLTRIMTQLQRPDLPAALASSSTVPRIAWKTGTSYGRRDAWSIGYNKNYTIGVWAGNFSGEGVAELTGADIATPLLFELFNAIDKASLDNKWLAAPLELDERWVCAQSGDIPNDFCEQRVLDYYIPAVSHVRTCRHREYVWVSADEKITYCTSCMPAEGAKRILYDRHTPEMIRYFEENHINYQQLPPHNPDCGRLLANQLPSITSLQNHSEYLLDSNDLQDLMLSCTVANDVERIFWFIDDKFYKAVAPQVSVSFTPHAGNIKISCADDKGRNSDIVIKVQFF